MMVKDRRMSTQCDGTDFDMETVDAVWRKGEIVVGIDPRVRRKDIVGAWIQYDLYGDTGENGLGWEIDHIMPVAAGGTDDPANLQPLQWQNNRPKGNEWPDWMRMCSVTSV